MLEQKKVDSVNIRSYLDDSMLQLSSWLSDSKFKCFGTLYRSGECSLGLIYKFYRVYLCLSVRY